MIEDTLRNEFELLKRDLITEHDRKGMRASGKTAESLEVETSQQTAKLRGSSVFEQLEYGRRKGKMSPIAEIKQWIIDKGIVIQAKKKMSITSLAWAIAKTHQKKGWKRKGHGGVGLVSNIITPQRMQQIINKIGITEVNTLVSKLEKELTNIIA